MLNLYSNIKRRRIELGMSQDELAKRTGYTSRSSIAKIEKGLVDLPQTKIQLFAQALGVEQTELMGWDHFIADNAAFHASILKDKELLEMIRKYKGLSPARQEIIKSMIDEFVAEKKDWLLNPEKTNLRLNLLCIFFVHHSTVLTYL